MNEIKKFFVLSMWNKSIKNNLNIFLVILVFTSFIFSPSFASALSFSEVLRAPFYFALNFNRTVVRIFNHTSASFSVLLDKVNHLPASVNSLSFGANLNTVVSSTTPRQSQDIVPEEKKEPQIKIIKTIEISGVSQNDIDNSVNDLKLKLERQISEIKYLVANQQQKQQAYNSLSLAPVYQAISLSNKIDKLSSVTISGATISDSSFSGSSITLTGGLDSVTGNFSGALSGGSTTISGVLTVSLSSGTSTISSDVNFDSGTLYVDSINNRIGVGTSTPWGQFSINPNGITTPSFVIGSSTATNFVVTNGGNVGVGTSSPFVKFTVVGDAFVSGNLTTNTYNATSTFAGSLKVNGPSGLTVSKMDSSFATRVDLSATGAALGDKTADLNGDGRVDAVGVDYTNSNMTVFLNSSGVLSAPVTYTAGTNPIDSIIGDVNNDGSQDVIVGNYTANTISVFINNGDGTFANKVDYSTGAGPNGVDIGDINRDGWNDIVAVAQGASGISVLLNNGDGTFASYVSYSNLSASRGATFGDFNGDGWLDVATACWSSSKISIFLNNGDGTLATRTDYSPNSGQPYWVGVDDFDGDGYDDVVSTNANGPSTVSIFMGSTSGTLASPVAYSISIVNPFVIAIGDLNDDTRPDIVIPNNNTAQISVLINNGNGTFRTRKLYNTVGAGNSIAVGDVNGDGLKDVIHGTSSYISTFINNLYPTFYAQSSDGNLGVGTTTPWGQFSINPNSIGGPSFVIGSSTRTDFIVKNTGVIGLGTTSPTARLSITQSANDQTGGLYIAETGNTDFRSIYMNTSGVMSFLGGDTGGSLNTATLNAAGAWTSASDISYKENIIPLNNKYSFQSILNLKPVYYEMKGNHLPQIGFIAQDIEKEIPEVVSGEEGSKGISYGNLTALTVSAVQDLASVLNMRQTATSTFSIASSTASSTLISVPVFSSIRLNDIESRILNLESKISTSTVSSFVSNVAEWMGSKITSVLGVFDRVETKELCLEDICVTKEQFKTVFSNIKIDNQTNVVSTSTPVITLIGNNPSEIALNSTYIDLGATALDSKGQSLMPDLASSTVDTSREGTYEVVWVAHDSMMNFATSTRTVVVFNPNSQASTTLPVIDISTTTMPAIIEPTASSTDVVTN